jgi:membrane protease YdiL (CAAX protease family)
MNRLDLRPLLELMGLMVLGILLSGLVSQYYFRLDLTVASKDPTQFLMAVASSLILSFGLPAVVWMRFRGHLVRGLEQKSNKIEDYFFSFVLFFACLFFAEYLFVWLNEFLSLRGWTELTEEPFNIKSVQQVLKDDQTLFLTILVVAVLPAIIEELFFRRIIFGYLYVQNLKFWPAAFLSSLFFAGVHEHFVSLFPIFLLGLSLSYAYYKTKSIWVPILLHALNNTLSILAIHWNWDSTFSTHWISALIAAMVITYIFKEKMHFSDNQKQSEIDAEGD